MRTVMFVVTAILFNSSASFAMTGGGSDLPPVKTVPYVDLNRYMGRWYSIASFPQWFEKECFGSRAEYSLREDGKVSVVNSCRKGSLEGKLKVTRGKAKVVDKQTQAKLKVTFFWPFYGDYWVIGLGDDYEYAIVGAPNRKYLWFLSRTPTVTQDAYDRMVAQAAEQGFDVTRLKLMPQPYVDGE